MLAFDRKAAAYDHHAHIQRDTAAWVAEWLPTTQSIGKCVEFGAGTGNFTRYLARSCREVQASDIAPQIVEESKQALPHVRWIIQDAWQPALSPAAWDYVASCSVLQWSPAPTTTLRQWRDLLRPGGKLISGIYVSPSLTELESLLPADRRFGWHSAADWRSYAEQAGFKVLRAETTTRRYYYPSALVLLKRLHGTGATVIGRPMPVGKLKRLLHAYAQAYATSDGVGATWTFFRLEAEKPR